MMSITEWNEDTEATLATTCIIGLLSMALKFGVYMSLPLHVAMVVVGIIHRHDCPANPRIPWYLFFGGIAGILSVALRIIMIVSWSCIKKSNKNIKYDPVSHPALAMVRAVHYLFRLFVIAWNITATFHIYTVVPKFDDVNSADYCHESTYMLAYVLVIIFDVLASIAFLVWISAIVAGMLYPEMVEDLYEVDREIDDGTSMASGDIELEEDIHSMREKQRKRRRKRRQKRIEREKKRSNAMASSMDLMPIADSFGYDISVTNISEKPNDKLTRANSLKNRSQTLPNFKVNKKSNEDIGPMEDKSNLAAVRFASLVDSRRISKDYYSQLMLQQEASGSSESGAQKLSNLFHPRSNKSSAGGSRALAKVSEEVS